MKPVKSVICLLLVGLMLLSLAACSSDEPQIVPETDDTTTTPAATPAVTGFVFPPAEALKVFADGAYSCRVMCPTAPSALEQTMYTRIREALESITGVLPELATDFLAKDEQGNLSSDPAILVGQTAYDESTAVYQGAGLRRIPGADGRQQARPGVLHRARHRHHRTGAGRRAAARIGRLRHRVG